MALSDITEDSVHRALLQFRELGRDAFLERYGFGKARVYFVEHDGLVCDSKAVAGAAHGFLPGMQPLGPNDFSGGERTVAKRLRELGFRVVGPADSPVALIDFEVAKLYSRRRDIHEVYGGQQQGGICTPQNAPFIFLFTGELAAGSVTATVPRRTGPMLTPARGNAAIWSLLGEIARSKTTLRTAKTCCCLRRRNRAGCIGFSAAMPAAVGRIRTPRIEREQIGPQSSFD